ncbi:MAG TPA: YdcF family protein [Alphaproteobacteria bacterium]|nr:YdcF family protein [Alphaproteobacteria bacterium]
MNMRRSLLGLAGLAFVLALAWIAGLVWFAERVSRMAPEPGATDAIVVLTGGSERIAEGMALLAAGSARMLFVSGVPEGVTPEAVVNGTQIGADALLPRIVLGHSAQDTIGNAAETAVWVQREGITSLRLVTANYHMPRSLIEFRRALPGVAIIPHPVFPPRFKDREWWRWPGTLTLMIREYDKYLLALLRDGAARITR